MVKSVVICDDNEVEAKITKTKITNFLQKMKYTDVEIEIYQSANALIREIETKNIHPYVIFMDVEMEEMTGMEAVKQIHEKLKRMERISQEKRDLKQERD